jgi:hypothetical protein
MSLLDIFTDHPAAVGETYLGHLAHASRFALLLILGGSACLVHALLPFLFANTASRVVAQLHERMVVKRRAGGREAAVRDGSAADS